MVYGSFLYSRRHRKPTGPRRLIAGDDLRQRDRDRDRGPDRSARFIWTDEPNKVQLFRGEIDRESQDNGYAELITLLEVEQGSANRSDAPAQEPAVTDAWTGENIVKQRAVFGSKPYVRAWPRWQVTCPDASSLSTLFTLLNHTQLRLYWKTCR